MNKDKQYKVFISHNYKPITIQANSKEEAEHEVRNNYVWGEPTKCMIKAYEDNESTGINKYRQSQQVPTKSL